MRPRPTPRRPRRLTVKLALTLALCSPALSGPLLSALVPGTALAQEAPLRRIRAVINSVDGQTLALTARNGETVSVALRPDTRISGLHRVDVGAIKAGSYIGVTALPQGDGTLKATEIHVFPEQARGTGEGHRPWDLGPGSSMTNGTVGTIAGTDGAAGGSRTVTVTYKGGEQTITVPADAVVVAFDDGDASLLKPGTAIIVFAGAAANGGPLAANRIVAGRDGLVPPM